MPSFSVSFPVRTLRRSAEFMEEWGLESGEMTDLQILRAIKNGQL
jgi:hypothetical protein